MKDIVDDIKIFLEAQQTAEQHGEQVEWDDDIDLNRCDCPTSVWDKYFTQPTKPMTQADKLEILRKLQQPAEGNAYG